MQDEAAGSGNAVYFPGPTVVRVGLLSKQKANVKLGSMAGRREVGEPQGNLFALCCSSRFANEEPRKEAKEVKYSGEWWLVGGRVPGGPSLHPVTPLCVVGRSGEKRKSSLSRCAWSCPLAS